MLRFLVPLALLVVSTGCQHHPLLVRGGMNVDGNVAMSGDVGMKGDMSVEGDMRGSMQPDNTASRLARVTVSGRHDAAIRIAIIDVDGVLVDKNLRGFGSMGENPVALFREKLQSIADDPSIAAVVLRINSPGGGVTASDIMAHELIRLKQRRQIPVIACLMGVGTGGAYYLATHADMIVAHPTSVVGGIGVILNAYNMEDTMAQFNILSMPIKAGEKIDIGSSERPMGDEERALLQKMADAFHNRFIDQVRASRPINPADDELFDGRVLTGTESLERSLVDQVGYLDDAIQLATQQTGCSGDSSVVMFRRDNDRAFTALDVTPNQPLQRSFFSLSLPGLDRSIMPTFLYLWQPDSGIAAASGG